MVAEKTVMQSAAKHLYRATQFNRKEKITGGGQDASLCSA
jgi:hypothetical protein